MIRILFLFIFIFKVQSQTFNLNNTYFENKLRLSQINGELDSDISFMIRPLHQNVKENISINGYSKNILAIVPKGETIESTSHNTRGKDKISFEEVLKKTKIYLS